MYAHLQMKNRRDTNILESVYILMFKEEKEIMKTKEVKLVSKFDAKPQQISKSIGKQLL